jgi:hypothetical protein
MTKFLGAAYYRIKVFYNVVDGQHAQSKRLSFQRAGYFKGAGH